MEFAEFAARAERIEETSADGEIRDRVVDLLTDAGSDVPIVARFVQGRTFPAHDSNTLDVGPALCYEAIAKAAGPDVSTADVEERLADLGDVGAVAASFEFGGQRGLSGFGTGEPEPLTIGELDERLRELAAAEGAGSEDTKRDVLFALFNRCEATAARYLARLALSEMRIGVGEGTVRDAIGAAFDVPVSEVQRALQVTNDCGEVAVVAREDGVDGLSSLGLTVGRPIKPMLAQTGTVGDALESWGRAAVEWKFDGARVQIHYDGSEAQLFSRNMEAVTDALPEVVETIERRLDVPAILDGEVVAVDDDGSPLPFQQVLRRFRRKHDVERVRDAVPVTVHLFDCCHANGEDLLDSPLTERYARLAELAGDENTLVTHVDERHEGAKTDENRLVSRLSTTDDAEEIAAIEREGLDAGHEGIMLKNPASAYTPGRRGRDWLKRKPDVETLDLVVTGAEWGEGRRANLFGTFLLSVRSEDRDQTRSGYRDGDGFATIGKVATGITDEELEALTELLEPHITREAGTEVSFEPAVVFEVGYEEIQSSPTYSSGYALRFPRFLGVRSDKDPADADSVDRVERLAENQ